MFTSLHTSEGTVLGLRRPGAAAGLIRQLLAASAAPARALAPAPRPADAPAAAARQAEPAWDAPAYWLRQTQGACRNLCKNAPEILEIEGNPDNMSSERPRPRRRAS